MLRFRMLARDVNSNPTQYRTWVVANTPDFNAQFYTGYKSGNNAFVDVTAYAINDDSVIASFNLPLPTQWNPNPTETVADFPIRKVLPAPIEDSQLAILDGYAYMFGGKVTNKIYRASLNNPADWVDTGAILPTPLYGSSLAIIDNNIYLFGGFDGYSDGYIDGYAANTIFVAPCSNPLSWRLAGNLPQGLYYSKFGMYNDNLYLFGGLTNNNPTNVILTASESNPTVWTVASGTLPIAIYGSSIAQVDGYWMLYGGATATANPSKYILRASVNTPFSWSLDGYLPYSTAFSQFVTVGGDGYLIGPMTGQPFTGFTGILQCHLAEPNAFFDTNQFVRGVISHSQSAIIADRIWLFGGSGEIAIFACNQNLKYNIYDPIAIAYGQATTINIQLTDNIDNSHQALGIPWWKTDYPFSNRP